MRIITLFMIALFASNSFAQNDLKKANDYKLKLDDLGITVEVFDSTNIDENRYTENNIVFREGVSFHYRFEHLDKNNEKYFFQYIDSLSFWKFIPEKEADENTIKQVIISVRKGLQGFDRMFPDYNQTIIGYSYPTQDNHGGSINSQSGVIENEGNVWMHPPRDHYFEILELNPFPYIKAPYEVGTKWTWSLTIGDHWADGRWKLWKGQIQNKYHYDIIDFKSILSKFGELECYIIESVAKSRIGETRLKSFFNEKYGFVRMEYTNIDGSKTNLELINYLDLSNSK